MEWLNKILELDTQLFLYLNQFHSDFWDTIMLLITRKETWFPFYLLIIYFIVKNYRNKSIFILLFLMVTIVASDQLSVLLKENIQRLRPVHEPGIQHLVHNVLRKGGLYGFVSSHAANSFAIFVFVTRVFKKRSAWFLFFFWAVIVSYSRIYSGVHYPLDILGGAILGWILALVFYKLLMFVENHFFIARSPRIEKTHLTNSQSLVLYLAFSILVSTLFIVVYILHYYNYL